MALLTNTERTEAARYLAIQLFVTGNATAIYDLDDLTGAIGSIDDTMNSLAGDIDSGTKINVAVNQSLPSPFSGATTTQKGYAMVAWSMKVAGII